MIVNDNDALARLHSPNNLLNQIRTGNFSSKDKGLAIFGLGRSEPASPQASPGVIENKLGVETLFKNLVPVAPDPEQRELAPREFKTVPVPNAPEDGIGIDDLLGDVDSQIKLATAHNAALQVMNATLQRIHNDIDTVNSAKLPAILLAAQKVVESVRKEKVELSKTNKERNIQYHFYTPTPRKIETFEVIEIGQSPTGDDSRESKLSPRI